MSRRSRAREIVLQVLYQEDLNPDSSEDVEQLFVNARLNHDETLILFAKRLLRGVRVHRDELDRRLEISATNWRLSRMAVTDRNVLRLGAYEVLFSDTPSPVAVNEAILLAKRYGSKNSSQFVNGILDRLAKNVTGDRPEILPSPTEATGETGSSSADSADVPESDAAAKPVKPAAPAKPSTLARLAQNRTDQNRSASSASSAENESNAPTNEPLPDSEDPASEVPSQ